MSDSPNRARPAVSVVMSVFNGEAFVAAAVASVLEQTFDDLELIVIDDGSTDATPAILARIGDPRVRVVTQENRGLTPSLNRGLELARAPLMARMDADDLARPERLERQVGFLADHPEVGLLGTWAEIDDRVRDRRSVRQPPTTDEALRRTFLFGNPFVHTSVMMRSELVRRVGGYDPAFRACEDYELWLRLATVGEIANLPEALVVHRHHWSAITIRTTTHPARILATMRVRRRAHRQFGHPLRQLPWVAAPVVHAGLEVLSQVRARRRSSR